MRANLVLLLALCLGDAIARVALTDDTSQSRLFKRRGGGRGGGGGGRGGSSSSGRGGGGGGGGVPSRTNTAPTSNIGGTSRGGSGPKPTFGGGRFFGGGGRVPYRAGAKSPFGIAPFFLIGASLAFWPGVWLHGAHLYPYSYVHHYRNESSGRNETAKVLCGCHQFEECGCEENNDQAFYDGLIGNGSYAALNKSVVDVGEFRGQKTLLINGTLPNGTTVDGPDSAASSFMAVATALWTVVATSLVALVLL
ncbi:hypothetical protein L249_0698 [Ophiocordyceps polyrhachis-furcata BCC 54312]|uniref:DUF7732 domain-containing protein n=1 Tax=Ophiocordyceps polyrhachis-furcata BCC 54312 TaxID=1330021 RepID=A0A367LF43_9HYPO|nr:hypothetical protein L249_0698 [Ophiocordyceps polyrhachis-furcata BCC 54312]